MLGFNEHSIPMLVLVVDDDPEEFELVCEALQLVTPEVHCIHSRNGEEALLALRLPKAKLPAYILLDINMPVMDGREFLIHIKVDPKLRSIPVVIYSTTSNPTEMDNFIKLGAKDFIRKPNSMGELSKVLDKVLR